MNSSQRNFTQFNLREQLNEVVCDIICDGFATRGVREWFEHRDLVVGMYERRINKDLNRAIQDIYDVIRELRENYNNIDDNF